MLRAFLSPSGHMELKEMHMFLTSVTPEAQSFSV